MEIQIDEIFESARQYARKFGTIGVNDYEDIAQVAMIKLISSGQKLNSMRLISVIVRSVAADFGRRLSHGSRTEYTCRVEENLEEITGSARDESEVDVIPQLDKILSSLSGPLREALVLHAEGYAYEEIAAMTGANINTAKTRVHYARKYIRPHWKDFV